MNDLKFTKTHEWVQQTSEGVTIGITAHAQELLGDMVFVELPEPGTIVSAGQEMGVVESVKAASDFYAPISGVVIAVNQAVIDHPEIVNTDPYAAGWLVKLQASDLAELDTLLNESDYLSQIEEH